MSYERWLRCDGCGNSLQQADGDGFPEGWFVIERQGKREEAQEQPDPVWGGFLWSTEEPSRPKKHICSTTCLERLGVLERETV